MQSNTVRTAGITVAAVLILLGIGALTFIYSGVYNIAATDAHAGLVRWALNTTKERSVEERGDQVPDPPPVDSARVVQGFELYQSMCAVCHGAPGVERGEFGKGMNPTPPDLSEEAREYSTRELFWITRHGLKMAGMPAFGPTHSDEEIWGIVAFVERLPEMSPEEYQRWVERYGSGSGTGGEAGHTDAPGSH